MRGISHAESTLGASLNQKLECTRELHRHFELGRLEERDLRMRLVLAEDARTQGELRRLCADLPGDDGRRFWPAGPRRG
jgi:hypothetical protein